MKFEIIYEVHNRELAQTRAYDVRCAVDLLKSIRDDGYSVVAIFPVSLEPNLKPYQTDEAMAERAARKVNKRLCMELEEVGKYRAKYKKQLKLHSKAFGMYDPYFPFPILVL